MDAEDALGRASLIALEKFSRYAGTLENPWAWLRRLVFNTCISLLRERQRERQVASLDDEEPAVEVPSHETPEAIFLRRELGHWLRRHIDALPEQLQVPVRMRLVLELEYSEIAERLSISENNARKRVQFGRERLRRQLACYLDSEQH